MDVVVAASKAVLFLLSLAFWAVALLFIGYSGYSIYINSTEAYHDDYLFEVNHFNSLYYLLVIGLGVILFIIGIIGMWATCSVNYHGLGVFKMTTEVFFLVELGIFIAAVYTIATGLNKTATTIHDIMQKYDGENAESKSVNYGQQQLLCCGVQGYYDWTDTPWFSATANNSVPVSCCANLQNCTGSLEETYKLFSQGCAGKFFQKKKSYATTSIIVSVILLVFTVLGKLSITQIRNRDYNYVRF